jgi:pyruvate,orthophosphate dikinase
MMNSFLNVGLNEAIVRGLIERTGKPWFGWDCYRRFLQCWGMFFGMERDAFDLVIDSYKREHDVSRKLELTPEQMRTVALAYRAEIENRGIAVVDDPKEQLRTAITLVLRSWDSKKARLYRELLDISEHWGTAVIIQAMVYGNLDTDAGTGVIFTRNPGGSGDRVMLWGDYSMGAQGEDVVSGLVRTACISVEQQRIEGRTSDSTLERSFPRIYERLLSIAKILVYREGWAAQEIEFTFEGGQEDRLHILQSRDMDVAQSGRLPAFRPAAELTESHLATGIGVGGGALCGRAVFDEEDIRACRRETPQARLILIRSDTVPDDIGHIAATDGLLTARGGATSHAALVAKKMGKICVVGCDRLIVLEREKKCMVGGSWIRAGDYLGIDGKNGFIYRGIHEVEEMKSLQEER